MARLRPTTEELLAHPYLMNKDKKSDSHTPPAEAGKIPTVCSAATTTPSSPGTKPVESRRLQELLKSHLVQGSPRTANAVNRVMVCAVYEKCVDVCGCAGVSSHHRCCEQLWYVLCMCLCVCVHVCVCVCRCLPVPLML